MSLLDILRAEHVRGKVLEKKKLKNGNIGLVVEDDNSKERYQVEFKDYGYPRLANLFGLFKEHFAGETEKLDQLIKPGEHIELGLSYSKSPIREAYYLSKVRDKPQYKRPQVRRGYGLRPSYQGI